jgi:17beta-estradiol 17-dehydrogenase / very-long-chain 3-oxoacyl-CoA reductase
VTGASAGIGRECAEELAARVSNVMLLGHLQEQLEEAKQQINRDSAAVEVKILVLDVAQAPISKIEAVLNEITDLPVTILVNNVGGVPAGLKYYVDQTSEELDRNIDLNARFMAQCTGIMVPVLAINGPSLMMNVSSIGRLGMPFVVSYSGAKAFRCGHQQRVGS